ncbi:uncharacterized protein LOC134284103 [Aedes albopictus]|uniref:Reverse transcriptase Ty1/copia-type domain-containing protein n=1 Tax=Aedes albopictus TaxID=7160 RepID=A0ABM1ZZA5_AEDAL
MEEAKPSKIPLDPGYLQTMEETSEMLPNNTQYASLVGGLLYVSVNTRPDIAASVSILGRKVSCPSQADWLEAKRVLRYLKHTLDHELILSIKSDPLTVYVDADWAGDANDRKSTSGYMLQLNGGSIFWSSKKQTCVSLSSTEAEYIALAVCCQEVQWILRILEDFSVPVNLPITIFEDNQSCIKQLSSPNHWISPKQSPSTPAYFPSAIVTWLTSLSCNSRKMSRLSTMWFVAPDSTI